MTPRISLIIGIAVSALALGVPSAFGERQPDGVAYFYANERATLGSGPVIHDHGDATQAKLVARSAPIEVIHDHGDATQAKLVAPSSDAVAYFYANERSTLAKQGSTSGSREEVRLDPNSPSPSVSSGSEIEWSQLAIGFGLGILLVAGLWLAMRMTKGRPLAH